MTNPLDIKAAIQQEAIPPLPRKRGEPVFNDSWEAEAYAMGNILVKQGLIGCREWMDLMAEAIRRAQASGDPDTGETYYHHWCSALESFCFEKGLISPDAYQDLLTLWGRAIANTPHGVPLVIENAAIQATHSHHHFDDSGAAHHHSHDDGTEEPPSHYWTPLQITKLNKSKHDG